MILYQEAKEGEQGLGLVVVAVEPTDRIAYCFTHHTPKLRSHRECIHREYANECDIADADVVRVTP